MDIRKISLLVVLAISVNGCSVNYRMAQLRERDINVARIEVKKLINVPEVKAAIRKAAKKMALIEAPKAETKNFILFRTNIGISNLLFGPAGEAVTGRPTKLGCFIDLYKDEGVTGVTVTEEVSSLSEPVRHEFADMIQKELVDNYTFRDIKAILRSSGRIDPKKLKRRNPAKIDRLQEFYNMKEKGLITEEDYNAKKREILEIKE